MSSNDRWHAQYLADAKTKAEGKDGTPGATIAALLLPVCFPEMVEPSPDDIDPCQYTYEEY